MKMDDRKGKGRKLKRRLPPYFVFASPKIPFLPKHCGWLRNKAYDSGSKSAVGTPL